MVNHVSTDIETLCALDLKKVGLSRYARHKSARILMIAWSLNRGPVHIWDCTDGSPMPSELRHLLDDPETIWHAFNAAFERGCFREIWGIDIPPERWRCTMIRAFQQSFAGTLGQIGDMVGLPAEMQKDKEGERLIRIFCMPQRVTKNQPFEWRDGLTDPEDWKRFLSYCKRDVVAESEILRRLDKYPSPDVENDYYAITERKNDAGIPIDRNFIEQAITMVARRKAELRVELVNLTGLSNPNSPTQLTAWLCDRGFPFGDINKNTVKKVLAESADGSRVQTQEVIDALLLRQQAGRTSVSKFDAILDRANDDDMMRHAFQFAGAQRTNRESGRGAQPHNLPRPPDWLEDDYWRDEVTETVRRGDYDWLSLLAKEPLDALVGVVRSAFCAPDGYEFVVADLVAIESAVYAYLSGDPVLMDIVRTGKDPYKAFATFWFGVAYEDVTKYQRKLSKPGMLGCFGPDTLVLTDSGWKPITETDTTDLVWDGVEWVRHDGCINQGPKSVIDMFGVAVTPDHEVLCGEQWRPACEVTQNGRYANRATCLAIGMLPAIGASRKAESCIPASVPGASAISMLIGSTLKKARRNVVTRVLTKLCAKNRTEFTFALENARRVTLLRLSPTAITRSYRGVQARAVRLIAMPVEGSSVVSPMFTTLSDMFCHYQTVRTFLSRSTAKITTGIMSGETCGCSVAGDRCETSVPTTGSYIRASGIVRKTFGTCLRRSTVAAQQSLASPEKDSRPNRSLPTSGSAKVLTTYDLVNCGPRNRFTIWTDAGPMIVHNCQYRMGPGAVRDGKKTGLLGYAEAMGIIMTQGEADAAVRTWRERFSVGKQYWYDLENAIMTTLRSGVKTRVGCMTFDLVKPYLRAMLPTGRYLYYHLPRVTTEHGTWPNGEPYSKPTISYMGKDQITGRWCRLYSHGGKFAENFTQALAREILYIGKLRAFRAGFDIRLTVHDEIGALRKIGDERFSLARLEQCMTDPIDSLPGIPLRADGWVGPYYRK